MGERTTEAVLFDIDGTLVDSNYLHVDTWDRAFAGAGHPVDIWRIHRSIGMDSKKLLETLLGEDPDGVAESAKELHGEYYKADARRLRPFAGAADLVRSLLARDVAVVLATSAPEDELEILLEVLGLSKEEVATTSSGDVDTAKPEPGIIEAALAKAGAAPDRAVMIGDTVWDVIAAKRAGVATIGVRSGGVAEEELTGAGAIEVHDDPRALLDGGPDTVLGRLLALPTRR
ncbi:HAD family hydrolase [Lysobacter korlensis]|uniref:HAD family hydrolase n=1 Tax=Lysobacter korlensis TaxID=553636 RepID=A0ABV6S0L8_9GAMM